MTAFVFNGALAMIPYYASLPGSTDSLVLVPLEASGLEDDADLRKHRTLAAVLAASNTEQADLGRIDVTTGITDTIDDDENTREVDFPNQVWLGADATGNDLGAVLVCYSPSSGAADSAIVPLTKTAYELTPAGRNILFNTADAIFGA